MSGFFGFFNSITINTLVTGGVPNRVLFIDENGELAQSDGFIWTDSTRTLTFQAADAATHDFFVFKNYLGTQLLSINSKGHLIAENSAVVIKAASGFNFEIQGNAVGNGKTLSFTDSTNSQLGSIAVPNDGTMNFDLTGTAGSYNFNTNSNAFNLRFRGDSDANLFFIDGQTDKVGIGNDSPAKKLDITGDFAVSGKSYFGGSTSSGQVNIIGEDGSTVALIVAPGSGLGFPDIQRWVDPSLNTLAYVNYNGGWVFNEQGDAAADFRVEGDTDQNLLFIDSSADSIGIGTNSPGSKLQINTVSSSVIGLIIKGSASQSASLQEWHNSTGSVLASMSSAGRLGVGMTPATTARVSIQNTQANHDWIRLQASDGGLAIEIFENADNSSAIYLKDGASATQHLIDTTGNTIFNETGINVDFRIEGDSDANCFFLDASADSVGIGTSSPAAKLDVAGSLRCDSISNDTGLAAGTYTPTLTNVANLDASTAYECQYIRVGNTVTVSGKVDVDPTVTVTSTQLGISLPISSNIGATEDLAGTAFAPTIAGQGAAILGDATNDRAQMQWISGDVTNQPMYFTFTYQVI